MTSTSTMAAAVELPAAPASSEAVAHEGVMTPFGHCDMGMLSAVQEGPANDPEHPTPQEFVGCLMSEDKLAFLHFIHVVDLAQIPDDGGYVSSPQLFEDYQRWMGEQEYKPVLSERDWRTMAREDMGMGKPKPIHRKDGVVRRYRLASGDIEAIADTILPWEGMSFANLRDAANYIKSIRESLAPRQPDSSQGSSMEPEAVQEYLDYRALIASLEERGQDWRNTEALRLTEKERSWIHNVGQWCFRERHGLEHDAIRPPADENPFVCDRFVGISDGELIIGPYDLSNAAEVARLVRMRNMRERLVVFEGVLNDAGPYMLHSALIEERIDISDGRLAFVRFARRGLKEKQWDGMSPNERNNADDSDIFHRLMDTKEHRPSTEGLIHTAIRHLYLRFVLGIGNADPACLLMDLRGGQAAPRVVGTDYGALPPDRDLQWQFDCLTQGFTGDAWHREMWAHIPRMVLLPRTAGLTREESERATFFKRHIWEADTSGVDPVLEGRRRKAPDRKRRRVGDRRP